MLTGIIGFYLKSGKGKSVEGSLCVTAIMLDMAVFTYMAYI